MATTGHVPTLALPRCPMSLLDHPVASPRPYPGEVSSVKVKVAPLNLRVSHSFTSRSRICRDKDAASVAAWPSPRPLPAARKVAGGALALRSPCRAGARAGSQETCGDAALWPWHGVGNPRQRGPYLAEPHGDEAIAGAHPEQPGVLVVLVSRDALQGTGDTAVSIPTARAVRLHLRLRHGRDQPRDQALAPGPHREVPTVPAGWGQPPSSDRPESPARRWPPRCWCGGWDEQGVAAGNVSVMARIPGPPAPPGLPLWQAWGLGGARAPRSCSMLAGTRRCLTLAMAREGEALTSPDASPGSRSVPNPGCRREVPHGCPEATETPMAN